MRTAVIGAGVVGLWTALIAVERGAHATVFEESEQLGRGASGHNAGVIHLIQTPFNTTKSRLAVEGSREYDSWAQRLGLKVKKVSLLLATTHSLGPLWARAAAAYLRHRGYPARAISPKEARENHCPQLSRGVKAVVEVKGYKVVDPMQVLRALVEELERRGVELNWGTRVNRVEARGGQVKLATSQGDKDGFHTTVVAAGAGSREIALASGAWAPRQYYARGVMAEVELGGDCDAILSWLPLRSPRRTKGGGVIPRVPQGHLLGPDFRKTRDPWDTRATREEALELARRFTPLLAEEPSLKKWFAGTRVVNMPKDDFILHRWGRVIFLYGIDSPGLTAAPVLARMALEAAGVAPG